MENGGFMGKPWENGRLAWNGLPLANQQKTDGKITILNGETAMFNSYVSHYQWDTRWKMVVLWENHGKMVDWLGMAYPLANQQKTDGKITILNGKTAIFNSYVSHYQWDTRWKMVGLWENHTKTRGKWWFYHVLPSGKRY